MKTIESATEIVRSRTHRISVLILLLFASFTSVAQDKKWVAWEVEADTLMQRQRFSEAAKLYTKVMDATKLKEASDYRALYKRGVAFYSLKEFPAAIQDVDRFISNNSQILQGHILRALIYRELDDADKQLESVEAAIELSSDAGLMKWRATLNIDRQAFEDAKRDLIFIRQLQPDPEAETQLGVVYHALQKSDSAITCINRAIELEPNYLPAYYYGGSICLQDEQYKLALGYLNVGLRIEPDNASFNFYKGIALIELQNIKEGCRALKKAFDAGEDDAADYLIEYCYRD